MSQQLKRILGALLLLWLPAACTPKRFPIDPGSLRVERQVRMVLGKPMLLQPVPGRDKLYVVTGVNRRLFVFKLDLSSRKQVALGGDPIGLALGPKNQKLLVCLNRENKLAVIDIDSDALMYKIPVGLAPFAVVVDRKRQLAWVSQHHDDSVGLVDLKQQKLVKRIGVGAKPLFMALTPDGSRLLVTNYGSHSVSVLDTRTRRVLEVIVVDSNPVGIAVSPDGKRAYVANYHGSSISVLNLTSMKVEKRLKSAPLPYYVSVRPRGDEFVVTHSDAKLITLWQKGRSFRIPTGASNTGIAFSEDGLRLYLAGFKAGVLTVLRGERLSKP